MWMTIGIGKYKIKSKSESSMNYEKEEVTANYTTRLLTTNILEKGKENGDFSRP